jgi:hypothetical protein
VIGAVLIVIAKDPRPGRSKTRLCPPCLPVQAAGLAEAALRDTLEVVRSVPACRHVLALDGDATRWRGCGFEILAQRGAGLDERLENAFADVCDPALLVGMDTPQLTVELLSVGLEALNGHAAVLGPASDGGYWSVGMRAPTPGAFRGVAMSAEDTLAHQRARFEELGLSTYEHATLRDVDTIEDAHAVAAQAPGSRFAAALREVG